MTTVVVRPVVAKNNYLVPPRGCVGGIGRVYRGRNTLLVYSRMVYKFKQANGPFNFVRCSMGPSVVAVTGKVADTCLPLSTATIGERVCRTCDNGRRCSHLHRMGAFKNGPTTYTLTLGGLRVFRSRGLVRHSRFLKRQLLGRLRRMGSLPFMNSIQKGKLLVNVRLIRSGRSGGPTDIRVLGGMVDTYGREGLVVNGGKSAITNCGGVLRLTPPLDVARSSFAFVIGALGRDLHSVWVGTVLVGD